MASEFLCGLITFLSLLTAVVYRHVLLTQYQYRSLVIKMVRYYMFKFYFLF